MAGPFPGFPIGGLAFGPEPATPYQATLSECSFRGVAFIVEEFGGGVGRRGDLHEYPQRDIPNAEDLGRRARRWRWRCYVLGDDCMAQADILKSALEVSGPGMLVLPDGNMVMAQVDPAQEQRFTQTWDKGRKVSFELSFVEAGQNLFPGTTPDTQANSLSAAASLDNAGDDDQQNGVAQVGGPNQAPALENFQNASAQLDGIGSAPPGDVTIESINILPGPVADSSNPTFGAQDAF